MVLAGCALACGLFACRPDAPPESRGVILIISDSLRADRLGSYGHRRDTSPALDRLAAEGVRFERAYSQSSWTRPSVASLFTSLYPSVHRVGHPGSRFGYVARLPDGRPTLAEVMRGAGFRTRAILNNPSISPRQGFPRGFERFDNDEKIERFGPAQPSYEQAVAALEAIAGEDFLLVWHLLDPHWPYYPAPEFRLFVDPEYDGRFAEGFTTDYVKALTSGSEPITPAEVQHLLDLYDGEIRSVDHQVAQLLGAIDRLGLRDRVSVVFTSDHGESFFEYGHFGHSLPIYEETLRVPLIVFDTRFSPRAVPEIVEGIDLMPTLLDLAGIPVPDGLQGHSLRPLLEGDDESWEDGPALSEAPQFLERKSLRTKRYRLIYGVSGRVLEDGYVNGTDPFQFTGAVDRKLYAFDEASRPDDTADARPDVAASLVARTRAMLRGNEAVQAIGTSMYRTLLFDADWRRAADRVAGTVEFTDGALRLDAQQPGKVGWKVEFPRPLYDLELNILAWCDAPGPYFSVSRTGSQWEEVSWPRAGVEQPQVTQFSAGDFAGAEQVYLQFFRTDPGRCVLKGVQINASFSADTEAVDPETRANLEALGYTE